MVLLSDISILLSPDHFRPNFVPLRQGPASNSSCKKSADVLRDRHRGGEPGRFDAVQAHQPGNAVVFRPLDQEVGSGCAFTRNLGADAGVTGLQLAVLQNHQAQPACQ